jgi:magnesium-transporting ATPase (P-type)
MNQGKPRLNRRRGHAVPLPADLSPVDVARWSPSEALDQLRTGLQGLSQREAGRRLKAFGRNELARHGKRNSLVLFAGNFVHLLALLLADEVRKLFLRRLGVRTKPR